MFRVVSVLLCLLTRCWQLDGNMPLSTKIPDIISHLCPGINICSHNRSSETSETEEISLKQGTESCCAECSCLANCTKTGNCCYPSMMSPKRDLEVDEFQNDRSCLYPMIPQPSEDHHLYQSFNMVSSVSTTSGAAGLCSVSCGDMTVAPWGSFYPVYSVKSKQIYKNIECAKEYSKDSDIIQWDAVINCEEDNRGDGIDMIISGLDTHSIPKGCRIHFVYPGDFDDIKPLKCFSNLIDTCTDSSDFEVPGGINVSKDDIRALCAKSGFVSPYRARKLYANVFCHICSAEYFYRKNFCYRYSDGVNWKGRYGEFMALIDHKFITEQIDTGDTKSHGVPTACTRKEDKEEDMCRPVFCPTGQLRDRTKKCAYPNKIWYNQRYVVFVNLTLNELINVSDVFDIIYRNKLPSLKSTWLNRWTIESVRFRVMEEPYMSDSFVFEMYRELTKVKPDAMIMNIKKMIGQAWSIRLGNDTEIPMSSKFFPLRTDLWRDETDNRSDITFPNLTENVFIQRYKQVYGGFRYTQIPYRITKLYICNQVELEPTEFSLMYEFDILYNYITKRFMFDGQFRLLQSPGDGKYRVRVCLEDSGLFKRDVTKNFGKLQKPTAYCFVAASVLLILEHVRIFYQL